MSIYNKINAGFSLGTGSPVTAGIEDVIYIFNQDDITLTYDTMNPLIVKGLTAVDTGKVYKFEGKQQFQYGVKAGQNFCWSALHGGNRL